MERSVDIDDAAYQKQQQEPSTDEFTSGCAGGTCQLGDRKRKLQKLSDEMDNKAPVATGFLPWIVPEEVRQEIEDKLLPVLPEDAHCGSVEFLYKASTGNTNEDSSDNKASIPSRRLYFDLNLLSTLPVDPQSMDPSQPDPWAQLAGSIVDFCRSKGGKK